MGREAKIAILIGALLLGVGAGVYTSMSTDEPAPTPTAEPAAAKAAPTPAAEEAEPVVPQKQRAQAQHEKNPPHVRLSNVKLKQAPQKKDFSKVAPPEKDKPADEEESE